MSSPFFAQMYHTLNMVMASLRMLENMFCKHAPHKQFLLWLCPAPGPPSSGLNRNSRCSEQPRSTWDGALNKGLEVFINICIYIYIKIHLYKCCHKCPPAKIRPVTNAPVSRSIWRAKEKATGDWFNSSYRNPHRPSPAIWTFLKGIFGWSSSLLSMDLWNSFWQMLR